MNDKEVKKWFKNKASKSYKDYYACGVLEKEGFDRRKCECGTYFWTTNSDQKNCDDPACSGGFRFIGRSPAKKELDYIELWKEFSRLFKKWGYTPINRYPVVARWRDDTDFVQASIYNFQPFVVSGEIKPPANPLVVPQFSLRFNDIDNVGITGAHYTGFVMIGQHAFDSKKDWDQDKYFTDIHNWCRMGLGLPNSEITYHEDAWAGGGNFGPSMEFFSRGLELGNQVYMMYEKTPSGHKELNLKVLDMGMGHERNAWFTKGASTSYETTFPTVCKKMFKSTGLKIDKDLMKRFLPYSSYLNIDEALDIGKVWLDVANKTGVNVSKLRGEIIPLSALFSIAEHSRTLLFALSDGALPSNVGGGYNLRVILRRALSFINKYEWDVNLSELCQEHAKYLKPIYPELMHNLENVKKILEVEGKKFEATKEKTHSIVSKLSTTKISEDKLIELYDSNGISPELIRNEASKNGQEVIIPEDFYVKVSERHEQKEQQISTTKTKKYNLEGIKDTEAQYFDDYTIDSSKGKVLKILGNDVVLDKTIAYPTSGGQIHDEGSINGQKIKDIFKQGAIIIHKLNDKPNFKKGDKVKVVIDSIIRKQLAQHHTATHIVNAACRKVLGDHINQAGARKTIEKATLDITHYERISNEDVQKIENEANKIVSKDLPIKKFFMDRGEAEQKYGMRLYQGGAVPGKKLRIVDIKGIDVEACGGTHLNHTSEVGKIKIFKTTKIQDGIVRIFFSAGEASTKNKNKIDSLVIELAKLLEVETELIPAAADALFLKWKQARKAFKKGRALEFAEDELKVFDGDIVEKTSEILKTQKEHLTKTISRFRKELEEWEKKLKT